MSGAGKAVAIQSFEDMDYFYIDNVPSRLIPEFWELIEESSKVTRVALGVGLRSRSFSEKVQNMLIGTEDTNFISTSISFLGASDKELVARYKEARRIHPTTMSGLITEGICKEQVILDDSRTQTSAAIDTTILTSRRLRERINEPFKSGGDRGFRIEFVSFNFKYGLPIDSDIVIDMRFLPNPHYASELRPSTRKDQLVYSCMMSFDEAQSSYHKFLDLLGTVLPGYIKGGKNSLIVAVDCTGGQHHSVALTECLANVLGKNYEVGVTHQDKDKGEETVSRSWG